MKEQTEKKSLLIKEKRAWSEKKAWLGVKNPANDIMDCMDNFLVSKVSRTVVNLKESEEVVNGLDPSFKHYNKQVRSVYDPFLWK